MSGCGNKPKHNCGSLKSNSRCVFYDLNVPDYSKLEEEDCTTVEEVLEDLYNLVTELRDSVNLEDLKVSAECLELDKVKSSYDKKKKTYLVKDVLKVIIEKLCNDGSPKDSASGGNSNSDNCFDNKCVAELLDDLDYRGLVDKCGRKPSSLKGFFQLLIDNIAK